MTWDPKPGDVCYTISPQGEIDGPSKVTHLTKTQIVLDNDRRFYRGKHEFTAEVLREDLLDGSTIGHELGVTVVLDADTPVAHELSDDLGLLAGRDQFVTFWVLVKVEEERRTMIAKDLITMPQEFENRETEGWS